MNIMDRGQTYTHHINDKKEGGLEHSHNYQLNIISESHCVIHKL